MSGLGVGNAEAGFPAPIHGEAILWGGADTGGVFEVWVYQENPTSLPTTSFPPILHVAEYPGRLYFKLGFTSCTSMWMKTSFSREVVCVAWV